MVRPRNVLMAWDNSLSADDASKILRQTKGDIEAAKIYIQRERNTKNGTSRSNNRSNNEKFTERKSVPPQIDSRTPRAPPHTIAKINNLSDRQYCCVWSVEVYEDGYRPDVARTLLATVARHVNPILRERGWRCKRLIESSSSKWIGLCTSNGRTDADAASTNIQLNLRTRPDKHCSTFRTFQQILKVLLHEITHTSIGLEDIHPPAFYELLDEIRQQYKEKLLAGEVDLEIDDYGCNGQYINRDGSVGSVASSAAELLGDDLKDLYNIGVPNERDETGQCGVSKKRGNRRRSSKRGGNGGGKSKGYISNVINNEKKRPLLKGAKLIDKRTKVGREVMEERRNLTPRELAAKAAMTRISIKNDDNKNIGNAISTKSGSENNSGGLRRCDYNNTGEGNTDDESDDNSNASDDSANNNSNDIIVPHPQRCSCRSCDWSKIFLESMT